MSIGPAPICPCCGKPFPTVEHQVIENGCDCDFGASIAFPCHKHQVARCQDPTHNPQPWAKSETDRLKRGERQVFCGTCKRWKWRHELCTLAVVDPKENADLKAFYDVDNRKQRKP